MRGRCVNIALRDTAISVGKCIESGDSAQILLAVSATKHLFREHLVKAHARSHDRDLCVVDPIDKGHEAQRL
jgi:hypothetical protein